MRYLGGLRGAGTLSCGDETVGRVDYELEGYLSPPDRVTGSGEIRMPAAILKQVFTRKDLWLVTDDGRRLSLQFSEKRLLPAGDAAHVDVTGDLPPASEWRH